MPIKRLSDTLEEEDASFSSDDSNVNKPFSQHLSCKSRSTVTSNLHNFNHRNFIKSPSSVFSTDRESSVLAYSELRRPGMIRDKSGSSFSIINGRTVNTEKKR